MSEKLNEQLSALVDGELPEAEKEMLLTRLARDPDLKRTWQTYHTISASLRNQLPEQSDRHLVERVNAALAEDPPMVAEDPRIGNPLARCVQTPCRARDRSVSSSCCRVDRTATSAVVSRRP